MSQLTHKGRERYCGSGVYSFDSICGSYDEAMGESIAHLWKDVDCGLCLKQEPTDKNRIRDLEKKIEAQGVEIKTLRELLRSALYGSFFSDTSRREVINKELRILDSTILNTQEGLMYIGIDPAMPNSEASVIHDGKCILKIINIGEDSK